jgi:adiponectin receptor
MAASTTRLRVVHSGPEVLKRRAKQDLDADKAEPPALLLPLHAMPQWFRDESNEWILHGYRPISGSVRASFRSWRYLHNETVNIYTHLIPAIILFFAEFYLLHCLASSYSRVSPADFLAFSSFIVTATTCYGVSALYHTLTNHSYNVDHFWHRLDLICIGIYIVGDIILGVYLIFWCETTLRNIYWCIVSCFPHARFCVLDW